MFSGKRGSLSTFMIAVCILFVIILIKLDFFDTLLAINSRIFVWPLVILFCTVVVSRLIGQMLHRHFEEARARMKVFDRTRYTLFTKLVTVIIWAIGIGIIIGMVPQLRAASLSFFAGAGVLAIVVGFAMQKTFGNLASGVFIATFQPYRIGDKLDFMGEYGTVVDINLRHTTIETWDNRRINVPNSKMDEEVINNFTIDDPTILGTLDMEVSYDADIDKARAIMREEAMLHPDFYDKREHADMLGKEEPVRVRVFAMKEFSVVLKLYYWAIDQPTNIKMRCDLTEKIKKRFDQEGIEIPFPYRTLVYKKDLEQEAAKEALKKRPKKRPKKR